MTFQLPDGWTMVSAPEHPTLVATNDMKNVTAAGDSEEELLTVIREIEEELAQVVLYEAIKRILYEGVDVSCDALGELCEAFEPFNDGVPYADSLATIEPPPPSAAQLAAEARCNEASEKLAAFREGLRIHCPDCNISWMYGSVWPIHPVLGCKRPTPGGQRLLQEWIEERRVIYESRGGQAVEDKLQAEWQVLYGEWVDIIHRERGQ